MSATERIYVCARIELFQLYQKIVAFGLYKAVLELIIQSSHDSSPISVFIYNTTFSNYLF